MKTTTVKKIESQNLNEYVGRHGVKWSMISSEFKVNREKLGNIIKAR
jgi:hypothetical protein